MIQPELLSIEQGASWESEFGLNHSAVKSIIFSSGLKLLEALDAQSIHYELFDRASPCSFTVGKDIGDTHAASRLLRKARHMDDVLVFHAADNNIWFNDIAISSVDGHVKCVMVTAIYDDLFRYLGAFLVTFDETKTVDKLIQSVIGLHTALVANQLMLAREKRIRADEHELHTQISKVNNHPIFVKDRDYRIVYANQSFLEVYPEDMRQDILGTTTVESFDEKAAAAFLENDRIAFEQGFHQCYESLVLPNGNKVTLHTTKSRFQTQSKQQFILGVSYDVTDHHRIITQLKKRNQEMKSVASVAIEELQPLTSSIAKMLQWSQQDLLGKNTIDDNTFEALQQARGRVTRMRRLLQDMTEYLQVEQEKDKSLRFNLRELVEQVAHTQKLYLQASLEVDDIVLELPQKAFGRVVAYLLDNSLEHNDKPDLSVEVRAFDKPHQYIFEFIDNGVGIPESFQALAFNLFERYYPGELSDGTGKGLAICKKIIEHYDGTIHICQDTEDGCKLIIQWPKAK